MTLDRKLRKVSQILGGDVLLEDGKFVFFDERLGRFEAEAGRTDLQRLNALDRFHSEVYRARGREKYRDQIGLCAICNGALNGCGEIDHIKTRAKGRDDSYENLRVLDSACHRHRHGG